MSASQYRRHALIGRWTMAIGDSGDEPVSGSGLSGESGSMEDRECPYTDLYSKCARSDGDADLLSAIAALAASKGAHTSASQLALDEPPRLAYTPMATNMQVETATKPKRPRAKRT